MGNCRRYYAVYLLDLFRSNRICLAEFIVEAIAMARITQGVDDTRETMDECTLCGYSREFHPVNCSGNVNHRRMKDGERAVWAAEFVRAMADGQEASDAAKSASACVWILQDLAGVLTADDGAVSHNNMIRCMVGDI